MDEHLRDVKEFEQGVTDMKKVSSRMFHHSMRES
jgi:hypothetical protein